MSAHPTSAAIRSAGRRCYVRSAGCITPNARSPAAIHALATAPPSPGGVCRVADDVLAEASGLRGRDAKRQDRFAQLAVAAARMALASAADLPDPAGFGVVVGNMAAGWSFTEPELRKLHSAGIDEVSPYLASAWFPAAAQGQITIHLGLRGYAKTIATDRCAGSQAIGHARERIRHGFDRHLLAGGAEAPVTPFVMAAYRSRFGDASLLAEAAAFLLLSTDPPAEDPAPAVCITGHHSRPLYAGAGLGEQFQALLTAAAPDWPADAALLLNTLPSPRIEAELAAAAEALPMLAGMPIRFANRTWGDGLAAGAPLAAVVATEMIRRREQAHVAVVSVGHQCLDLLIFSHQE